MNKQLDCVIVKDLLPNYIDGLTSKMSNEYIEDHLQKCNTCNESYESMKMPIQNVAHAPEIAEFNGFLKKTKRMYLLGGTLLSLGFIGIFISMLVDGILNRKFTWSLIVLAGITFVYAIGLTAIRAKKNKFVKSALVFTILLFPLLEVISMESAKLSFPSGREWFLPYGFEIALLWIVAFWIGIGVWSFTHKNIWYGCATIFFLSIPCDFLMQEIIKDLAPSKEPFWLTIIEVVIYSIVAVTLWYIGRRSALNKTRKEKTDTAK